MNGAQALGCSPVATAFAAGTDVCRPVKPNTIAKSLAIGNPADGPYAIELARRPAASIDSVTDDEIRAGIRLLAETTGIFTETAGGVTIGTLAKIAARGDIGPDERVVAMVTGDGLKTIDAVRDTFEVTTIPASLDAFDERSRRWRSTHGGHGQAPDPAARRRGRRHVGRGRGRDGRGGARRPLRLARRAALADRRRRRRAAPLRQRVSKGEDIRFLDGLDTAVSDGDEVTILPAVAGG